MRYVGTLINVIRERTDNQGFVAGSTQFNPQEGISDDLILEFLNEAQDFLFSQIKSHFPDVFTADKEISLVADQEAYTPNDNVYLDNAFIEVEYSHSGNIRDYCQLPQKTLHQRRNYTTTRPTFYIRHNGQILVNPIAQTSRGKIRVTYYRDIDDLDIRRGKIDSSTNDGSGNVDTITLLNDSTLDNNALNNAERITVVDDEGTAELYDIKVDSYTPGTFTLDVSGATGTVSDDNFVILGRFSTTHSQLQGPTERYIKLYAQLRCLNKDSSIDAVAENSLLVKHERDILNAYAELSQDIVDIPVIDPLILT